VSPPRSTLHISDQAQPHASSPPPNGERGDPTSSALSNYGSYNYVRNNLLVAVHFTFSHQVRKLRHGQAVQSALVRRWVRPCAMLALEKNGTRLPASDEVIGHIVAMHLPCVASNEVAGRPA
jgi:hypothetical protein